MRAGAGGGGTVEDRGIPSDAFAPLAGGRRLRDEIPGARLVVLEGEGHFVFDDAPALSASIVAGFLDEVAGQATTSGGASSG